MRDWNCWHCKAKGSWAENVSLSNVYRCKVCVPCVNAWYDLLRADPVWPEVISMEARMQAHEGSGEENRMEELMLQREPLLAKIKAMAEAFAPAPVVEPEKV